jgi:hypothetical protein
MIARSKSLACWSCVLILPALLASCKGPLTESASRVSKPALAAQAAPSRPRITGGPSQASTVDIVPARAVAPWLVAKRVNALAFSARSGLETVWGDYNERSEDPTYVLYQEQTQELGNAANGAHATYTGLDLGSGVDSVLLRVSLPSGTSPVEIRLGSVTGALLGTCIVDATGAVGRYRTVGCPVNAELASGTNRTIVFRFTGTNPAMRFNWFGFWARETLQEIDKLMKAQSDTALNRPSPTTPLAGTPVRTRAMLPSSQDALSRSYGAWSPSQTGDCPKWLHDTHWVRGDDAKIYATWHPPVDMNPDTGKYCTYGHEHGSDPRGSDAFAISGMPPFGFVNENHEPGNATLQRNEDHFGHKVLVANNWTMQGPNDTTRQCDLLVKIHVGTHSPDALTNTAHELHAAGQCEGLEPFNIKYFALFGQAGGFKEAEAEGCDQIVNPGIAPTPAIQPNGGVHRAIPTRDCFLRGSTADRQRLIDGRSTEFWLTGLFGGSLYYTIGNPSRFYDASSPNKASRMIDLCYDPSHPLAATLRCQESIAASTARLAWNDPRSSFRGTSHTNTHFSKLAFQNSPTAIVYTNAWGQGQRSTPDAAAGIVIRQRVPLQGFDYAVAGQASVIPTVDYSAGGRNGVRPPN